MRYPDLTRELVLMAEDPTISRARPVRRRFNQLIDALEATSARYAVCGAVALGAHGARRFTEDIDVLVDGDDIERVVSRLSRSMRELGRVPEDGPVTQVRLRSRRASGVEGVDVDLLAPMDGVELWALESAVRARAFARKIDVVSPEALLIMKLRAYLSEPGSTASFKHIYDARRLVHTIALDRPGLRKLVSSDPALAAELEAAFSAPPGLGEAARRRR